MALGGKSEAEAREAIAALEKSHGHRRAWPWAKFGWAPLARALEHLATMAQATGKALAGGDLDAVAQVYAETGWRADAAVLDALAAVERAEDTAAVTQAIRAVYQPWLTAGTARFQQLAAGAYPASGQPQGASGTMHETPAAFRRGAGASSLGIPARHAGGRTATGRNAHPTDRKNSMSNASFTPGETASMVPRRSGPAAQTPAGDPSHIDQLSSALLGPVSGGVLERAGPFGK